ncbi:hypothetical protein V490_00250, partial [Pseudogymnoascus sp. VKM F-3557]
IYGVYSYIGKLLVVTEHLDISLAHLDFQSYETEEWEIATIVAEVLKGLTYISSKDISCQDLTTASIRLSVRGEIKLLLSMENIRYHQVENPRFAPALLEMPVLEEIIEAMTLPRYHHTSDDQRWSKEALSFLSCSISGSLQNLNDRAQLAINGSRRGTISLSTAIYTWLDLFPLPRIAYPHDLFMVKRPKVPGVRERSACYRNLATIASMNASALSRSFTSQSLLLSSPRSSWQLYLDRSVSATRRDAFADWNRSSTVLRISPRLGSSTAPSVAPKFSLARRGYQDRWPGALPGVGVIGPGTPAEHKSFGEHNNGIDTEIQMMEPSVQITYHTDNFHGLADLSWPASHDERGLEERPNI